MTKSLAILLALTYTFTATEPAAAKDSLLKFNRQRVINVCTRACSRGGNSALCCICNGGDWTGRFCT
jgi:hypothetical protein